MRAERPGLRVLSRLEAGIRHEVGGRDHAVVAFSGGLGSLVLAGLARKRAQLRCVVVGTRGAADVGAALVARDFLDYRLDVLTPRPQAVLRTARAIRASDPGLDVADVLSLVPLALVEEHHPGALVLSGFGLSPVSPRLRRHLATVRARSPGLRGREIRQSSRSVIRKMAGDLAIPDGFAGTPRRTPAEGSGVGPALRAEAHERHVSVGRLIAMSD